jgi:hypothetical protein
VSIYTAISIKVVPEQSGKVEYEHERLAGNRFPASFSASFDFSTLLRDNLNTLFR